MDFEFNNDQEAWRNQIRGWIREEFGEDWNGLDVSNDEEGSDEAWEFSKGIRTKLAEKGWTAPAWPTEHGGMGLSFAEQAIFNEELAYHRVPGPDLISVGYVGPTLLVYGTDGQKSQFLDDIVNSRASWCQGYSEPGSGRTLSNMRGGQGLNEGFFEDVRGTVEERVGEENRGWYVGMATMDFERSALSGSAALRRNFEDFIDYLGESPAATREAKLGVADTAINIEVSRMLSLRVLSMQQGGLAPNHEASVAKMFSSELSQRFARFGINTMGTYGQVRKGDPYAQMKGWFTEQYMSSVPATIAGGSSEIQRGIIATRGLGLPRA